MPTFQNTDQKPTSTPAAVSQPNKGIYSFPPRDKSQSSQAIDPYAVEKLPRPGQNLFKEDSTTQVPAIEPSSHYSLKRDNSVMMGMSPVAAESLGHHEI
jgi:hypothetical protein